MLSRAANCIGLDKHENGSILFNSFLPIVPQHGVVVFIHLRGETGCFIDWTDGITAFGSSGRCHSLQQGVSNGGMGQASALSGSVSRENSQCLS